MAANLPWPPATTERNGGIDSRRIRVRIVGGLKPHSYRVTDQHGRELYGVRLLELKAGHGTVTTARLEMLVDHYEVEALAYRVGAPSLWQRIVAWWQR